MPSARKTKGAFSPARLIDPALRIIHHVQDWIATELRDDPIGSLESVRIGKKPMLTIDLMVERNTANRLRAAFGGPEKVHVLGEESLRNPGIDLSRDKRLIVLLDMVDGTDLLARGLSNWCSAMVFFKNKKILASFVGIPTEGIFFATDHRDGAFVKPPGNAPFRPVSGPQTRSTLKNASMCFYGQKPKNFLAVAEHPAIINSMKKIRSSPRAGHRIYNLAGNPMMMRMIDGQRKIDAVFDIEGQLPHDVVPGAYIAQKAGAVMRDIQGKTIELARSLLRPAHKASELKYVIAGSKNLTKELLGILSVAPAPASVGAW